MSHRNSEAILLVSQDLLLLGQMSHLLARDEHLVLTSPDAAGGMEHAAHQNISLAVIDLEPLPNEGLKLIEILRAEDPRTDIVVLAPATAKELVVRALKIGAGDYLMKPIREEEFGIVIERRLSLRQLLLEYNELKGTVELLKLCREIASYIEFEPLGEAALRTLVSVAGAQSGVFFWREPKEQTFRIVATHHLSKKDGKNISDRMQMYPESLQKKMTVATWLDDGTVIFPQAQGPALLLSLRMENKPFTAMALLFPEGAFFDTSKKEQIRLLAQQIELSLDNAFRYERAKNLAFVDDLTGLYNTRYLEHFVDQELKRAKRQKYPVSFLFVDLDFFKQVNDRFGHLIGSRLLVAVGEELHRLVRDIDVIIRYGGDEFVLILINTPTSGARQVAERIRARIHERPFLAELGITSRDVRISASIGVASFPEHGEDKETLLRLADEAMYQAKSISRNAIFIAPNLPTGLPHLTNAGYS